MNYLASPYSHEDPEVRLRRYREACRAAADLIRKGFPIYSPISHTHSISQHDLPKGWKFWKEFDTWFIERCESLWVLCIDGWKESEGVSDEIRIAIELGKSVWLVEFKEKANGKREYRLTKHHGKRKRKRVQEEKEKPQKMSLWNCPIWWSNVKRVEADLWKAFIFLVGLAFYIWVVNNVFGCPGK